jgi:hypothetical protein
MISHFFIATPPPHLETWLTGVYYGRDGKADYLYVASDGSVHLWLNRGSADTSRASDSVVFADIDGDGVGETYQSGPSSGITLLTLAFRSMTM